MVYKIVFPLFLATVGLPILIWILLIRRRDIFDPEPRLQFLKAFLLGFGVAFLAGIAESFAFGILFPSEKILGHDAFYQSLRTNILLLIMVMAVVATVEELAKYFILKAFFYERKEFNQMADGVFYAFVIALGFATIENTMYFISVAISGSFGHLAVVAIYRGLITLMLHLSTTGLIGYALGRRKFTTGQNPWKVRGMIIVAIIFHAIFNILTLQPAGVFIVIVMVVVCILVILRISGTQEENVVWEYVDPNSTLGVTSTTPATENTASPDAAIYNFIVASLAHGITKVEITAALMQGGGWNQADVERVLADIQNNPIPVKGTTQA